MRRNSVNILSGADYSNQTGSQIDCNQLVSASFHIFFGDATAGGVIKLQVSNDICRFGNIPQNFTVINWADLPNASATVASGAPKIITITSITYRWLRAIWTSTAAGVQTILVHADVAGSLNNKYFFINAGNNGIAYYVWFNVSSGGTDPMVAGKTGIEVDISTGDAAAVVGAAVASAIAAVNTGADFSTSGTTTVTVTNLTAGPFVPASDHNTSFTFAITGGGSTTVKTNMFGMSI